MESKKRLYFYFKKLYIINISNQAYVQQTTEIEMKQYILPAFTEPSGGAKVYCLKLDDPSYVQVKKIQETKIDGTVIIPSIWAELIEIDDHNVVEMFSDNENIEDCSYSMEELDKIAEGTERLAMLKDAINSGVEVESFRIAVTPTDIYVLIEIEIDENTFFAESYDVQL